MSYYSDCLTSAAEIREAVRTYGRIILDFADSPWAKRGTANLVELNSANIDKLPEYYGGGPVAVRIPKPVMTKAMDTEGGCWIASR